MTLFAKFAALKDGYDRLEALGHNPFDLTFSEILSPTEAMLRGRKMLLLGTNNYLGLTYDPECIRKSTEALQRLGTGTTGSRIANGSYSDHSQLEADLAEFYGRRGCMVFSTGYQANLGILSTLAGKGDYLIVDADSHASIYDGCNLGRAEVLRFRHNDPEDLDKRLRRLADQPGAKLIVVEGIYSMLGDTAPLREIVEVKRKWNAYLLVDEAHSLGVLGERGRGLAEAVGAEDGVDFIVGTFSKSLGSVGGFCVADHPDFDVLRIACRPYMFTASLPPAIIASTLEALHQLRRRPMLRHQLMRNAQQLHGGLRDLGFTVGPEVSPIVSVSLPGIDIAIAFWNRLLAAGLYLNLSLPPATPNSLCLLRSSVSAAHTPQQLAEAIGLFAEVGRDLGVIGPLPALAVGGR